MIFALLLFCILLEFRNGKNKILILIIGWLLITAGNGVIMYFTGFTLFNKIYPLTALVPIYLLIYTVSKHRGFKLFYTFLTVILLTVICYIIGFMLSFYLGDTDFWETFTRVIVFATTLFLMVKLYRKTYLVMLNTLEKGWAMLCAVPLFAYISIYPVVIKNIFNITNEYRLTILFNMVTLICMYIVNARFFQIVINENLKKTHIKYLNTQIKAIEAQSKSFMSESDKSKIYRHDMHHFLNKLGVLIRQGEIDAALGLVGEQEKVLQSTHTKRYCASPVINAILIYNFEQIIRSDIGLIYEIDLLNVFNKIDEIDLSTILANSLENAINACKKLPTTEARYIKVKASSSGERLVIQITNSFNGDAKLDKTGYPVTGEDQHGIGTKCIVALAEKYNGILNYKIENNIFRFSLLIE